MSNTVLEVNHLKTYYTMKKGVFGKSAGLVKAVDDVSFTIEKGKTFGLVGESGCGKTTIGKTILRLTEPTAGEAKLFGRDLFLLDQKELKKMRTKIQMIFQDPYSSLDPRMNVFELIGEAVREHHLVPGNELRSYVEETMEKCGLSREYIERFPHEFSGGQRQRICVARALALNPDLIICDEPVSALDVSIQAQVINLMKKLQREQQLSYLFISHDLSVVEHISVEVGVMYLGSMVEVAPKKELFRNPLHPYTKALLSAVPRPDPDRKGGRIILEGDVPSADQPPSGCKFHTRCRHCMDICREQAPAWKDCGGGHKAACHLLEP